jgi:hypothetical protein
MKYQVRRYFSGYCTYEVDAISEEEAYELSRNLPINENELLSTLEPWQECDEIEPIQDD